MISKEGYHVTKQIGLIPVVQEQGMALFCIELNGT